VMVNQHQGHGCMLHCCNHQLLLAFWREDCLKGMSLKTREKFKDEIGLQSQK